MKFEEAFASGRVAAWDRYPHNDRWCGIYEVWPDSAKLIAHEERVRDASTLAMLRARGLRIGSVYRTSGFLWIIEGADCELWPIAHGSGVLLRKSGDKLALTSRTLAASDVTAVLSFFDDHDYGHRGIKLALRGEQVLVAEEHDAAAELDVTYGWSNLLVDGGWITHLGQDLAKCLGVPHLDQLQPSEESLAKASEQPVQTDSEAVCITLEQGHEAAPDSPWGYQRVSVTTDGLLEYERKAGRRSEIVRGRIDPDKVVAIQTALGRTTFPQPPQATFGPGGSVCALTRSPPRERVLIDYFDGLRMEGYRDVLRELTGLRNALREGNPEVLAAWAFVRE